MAPMMTRRTFFKAVAGGFASIPFFKYAKAQGNREAELMQMLRTMETPAEYQAFQARVNAYLKADIVNGYIDWMTQLHVPPQRNLMIGRGEGSPESNPYDLFRVMRQLRPHDKLQILIRQNATKQFSEFVQLAKTYVF